MSEEREKPTENEVEKITPEIIRTILQDGVDFEITVRQRNLFHRLKLISQKRKFMIYPFNLGTLFNISKIILTMKEIELPENEDLFATGIRNIIENKDKMVEIIALGIMNKKISMPWDRVKKWWIKRYINNTLEPRELLKIVNLVIAQMDVADFLASTVSIKKLNLVGTAKEKKAS